MGLEQFSRRKGPGINLSGLFLLYALMYLALCNIKDRPVLNKTRGGGLRILERCRMSLDRYSILYVHRVRGGWGGGWLGGFGSGIVL